MARVHHVKKARKDNPKAGIKAGEEYWWWSKMVGSRGVKYYSKKPPTRQQLTNSEFLSALYDLEDRVSDATDHDDVQSIAEDIRALGEEQQGKLDNMPEGLQQGDTGQLLEERANAMEEWAGELEGVDEPDTVEPEDVTEEDMEDGEDFENETDRQEAANRKTAENLANYLDEVKAMGHSL